MKQESLFVTNNDPSADSHPTAIYVHGLASGANAATGKTLSKRFSNFNWITTDFGEDLAANVCQLNECIQEHKPQLIVGTSMGGLTLLYADAPDAVKMLSTLRSRLPTVCEILSASDDTTTSACDWMAQRSLNLPRRCARGTKRISPHTNPH